MYKETRLSPSPSESRPASDLNSRAENWLERARLEEEPLSQIYIEGLELLAELAGVNPNDLPLKRGASGKIIVVSEELKDCFSQGKEGCEGKIYKHAEEIASNLGRIDPLIVYPKLIEKTFFEKEFLGKGRKVSRHGRRLASLKQVGLKKECGEHPLILALQLKSATQRAMLEPIISRVENWKTPGVTVSLTEEFFLNLLEKTEYYRGFGRRLKEAIDQYAQKIFGEDAEEALSLWQEFIIPQSLRVKEWVQINPIQQQGLKLLTGKNWEKAREFLVELRKESPELFCREELKQYIGRKGKMANGRVFEVRGVKKRGGSRTGIEYSEPKIYVRLRYKKGKSSMLAETFINGIDSGEITFLD